MLVCLYACACVCIQCNSLHDNQHMCVKRLCVCRVYIFDTCVCVCVCVCVNACVFCKTDKAILYYACVCVVLYYFSSSLFLCTLFCRPKRKRPSWRPLKLERPQHCASKHKHKGKGLWILEYQSQGKGSGVSFTRERVWSINHKGKGLEY